jgi:hypothetical protein
MLRRVRVDERDRSGFRLHQQHVIREQDLTVPIATLFYEKTVAERKSGNG